WVSELKCHRCPICSVFCIVAIAPGMKEFDRTIIKRVFLKSGARKCFLIDKDIVSSSSLNIADKQEDTVIAGCRLALKEVNILDKVFKEERTITIKF
ncbi:hypothetical protein, partial [uncultured Sulfurimonas sp.]|uniref:hypothetical protein n=1 Tax=uncultured Sulfurimonas sp. TaxID=291845 RepID=UPI0032B192FF